MNKDVIYARFSSDKQSEDSIEAQVRACSEYAKLHGYTIVRTYEDKALSGRSDRRPEFQKMIKEADGGDFDTVLIHKYNRFARRMKDHVRYEEKLNDAGVDLIAVAEDFGMGKEAIIMKSLMRALLEYYCVDLADETKKGMRETALKGLHNGGVPPFGYDVIDRAYIINEIEAVYVKKMYDCAINRQGFTEFFKEMENCGIRGKRGKVIKYSQIYEILRNEKYTGTYTYSPQEESSRADRRTKPNALRKENALPIIISKAQFEEVQRIMNERKQTGKKAGYLCSGLVYCSCGAKMHGASPTRKGHTYKIFTCSARCGFGTVKMDIIDDAAIKYLRDLLSDENQELITKALRKYQSGEQDRVKEFNQSLNKQIADKQNRYDTLMNNLATGSLPPEVVSDIGQKMKDIKDEIACLRETEPPTDFTPDQIKAWLEALKKAPDEKAIHLLIERIDVKSKTDFNITSALKSVLGKSGCGGQI